ncbi:hypothetical protein TNIN_155661 [Trichonephila inaurata madagascariensis]|uniref:Uncharacterized protein n=1 Tax=Trichonephila inaurata madagascariensis TaxID=2747483 RepID=A0A8X6X7D1_9ARAC|nr:hypothetical protein TNIN_155661 [Trichonephila inaurata madagascariensis]
MKSDRQPLAKYGAKEGAFYPNVVDSKCCIWREMTFRQKKFQDGGRRAYKMPEQCDRYHESQGQRIECLAQLRESVNAIRQSETNFNRERRLVTARQTTSALWNIEIEENRKND